MILGLDNIASPKLVYLNHYLLIFFGRLTCERSTSCSGFP